MIIIARTLKRFFQYSRIRRTFFKYGGYKAPYYVLRWILFRKFWARLAAFKAHRIQYAAFTITGSSCFESLYTYRNLKEEVARILKGERKILSYSSEDENFYHDIKVRWELNRSHHAPILALWSRGHDARDDFHLIFHKDNYLRILEKTNAMEVAISVINLISSFQLLPVKLKDGYEEEFKVFLKSSLVYIIRNDERSILYSYNHFFFNLLGLIWICESITGNDATKRIKIKSYKALDKLLNQIIQADGSLYEASTHYHKYVCESLLLLLYQFRYSEDSLKLRGYAFLMYSFCHRKSVDHHIVGIGDNDSGRLLALPQYFDFSSSSLETIDKLADLLSLNSGAPVANTIEIFGLYKLQCCNNSVWVRFEDTSFKYRNVVGSHGHNDQLSIQLFLGNYPVLVDSGVYSYIKRDNCRINSLRTSSHNTVVIDDLEQGEIFNSFEYNRKDYTVALFEATESTFCGELAVSGIYYHLRKVILAGESIVVRDTIELVNSGSFADIYFHFHPEVRILSNSDSEIFCSIGSFRFSIDCGVGVFYIEDFFFSPEYGMKVESKLARLHIPLSARKIESEVLFTIYN